MASLWKRKVHGSILGFIGFMLSPLSWWNDAFVNLPLAAAFAWVVSLFYRPAFGVALIIGYWLTNVLGLVLMHHGVEKVVSRREALPYSRRDLLRYGVVSLLYTALILFLLHLKVLQPFTDYFQRK